MGMSTQEFWMDNFFLTGAEYARVDVDMGAYILYFKDGSTEIFDMETGFGLFGPALVEEPPKEIYRWEGWQA